MTGWIIFGCILLFLIWAFTRFATVTAVYDDDPSLWVKVLFFTIVKLPVDPEKQKRKAAKKAAKEKKRAAKAMKKAERERRKYEKKMSRSEPSAIQTETAGNAGADETEKTDAAEKDREKAETQKSDPEDTKKKKTRKPKKKKGGPGISIDMIRDYIKSASPPIKRLFRKIKIRDVYIDYVVGTDDAAKTAIKYGSLCAGIYSAAELLCEFMDTKVKEINIEADFAAEKDDIFAYGVVKLRISTALGCALWLGFRLLKTYLSYNKTTEKTKKQKPRPARAGAK